MSSRAEARALVCAVSIVLLSPPLLARECRKYNFKMADSAIPGNIPLGMELMEAPWSDVGKCGRVRSAVLSVAEKRKFAAAAASSAARDKQHRANLATYSCKGEDCRKAAEQRDRASEEVAAAEKRSDEANRAYSSIGSCECVEWGESTYEIKKRERAEIEERERAEKRRTAELEEAERRAKRQADYEAAKARRAAEDAKRQAAYEKRKKELDAAYAAEKARREGNLERSRSEKRAEEEKRKAEYTLRKQELDKQFAEESARRDAAWAAQRAKRTEEELQRQEKWDRDRRQRSEKEEEAKTKRAEQAREEMVDPFGDSPRKSEPKRNRSSDPDLVDPWAAEKPRPTPTRKRRSEAELPRTSGSPSATSESPEAVENGKRLFVASVSDGIARIDRRVEEASSKLSKREMAKFRAASEEAKSVLRGMNHLMTSIDYGDLAMKIRNADTPAKQKEAAGNFGFRFVTDATKYGIDKVAPRLFGRAAAVLTGPLAVAVDVATPERISPDANEVVHDNSGHYSLADKQEAVRQMWVSYERYGKQHWDSVQKIQLLDATELVYRESSSH
jgi:hypothetical protein